MRSRSGRLGMSLTERGWRSNPCFLLRVAMQWHLGAWRLQRELEGFPFSCSPWPTPTWSWRILFLLKSWKSSKGPLKAKSKNLVDSSIWGGDHYKRVVFGKTKSHKVQRWCSRWERRLCTNIGTRLIGRYLMTEVVFLSKTSSLPPKTDDW